MTHFRSNPEIDNMTQEYPRLDYQFFVRFPEKVLPCILRGVERWPGRPHTVTYYILGIYSIYGSRLQSSSRELLNLEYKAKYKL